MGTDTKGNLANRVDIVVVGWNHIDLTKKCLNSVRDCGANIIYVDNGTTDWSRGTINANWLTRVMLPKNTGYCHGSNVGMAISLLNNSEYVLLLNNDCEVPEGDATWLENLIQPMLTIDKIGAVGAVSNTVFGYQKRVTKVPIDVPSILLTPMLIGFCMLIRKEAIAKVGLLDERFDPDGNYSDYDYSIRLQHAGYTLAIAESVWINHVGSVSQKDMNLQDNLNKGQRLLFEKWDREALKLVGL